MYKHFFKRLFDLSLALFALPFWLVILMIIGLLIYMEDKGSIFYNASRLGKDGKIFTMYKFRSMKMHSPDIRNEDGSTFNAEDDPRLSRIGKFIRKTSLDETPQLLNILKGDMSIIGPRPDLPEFINVFSEYERKKLSVRPGITGYNQAYFRNSNELKEKFANDVYYAESISLLLDIKIFLRTVCAVLKRENVFHTGDKV